MADSADIAGEIIDLALNNALQRSRLPSTVASCAECDDCGEEIPQARRHAAPWATTCTECQSIRERKSRHVS
ncbi:TraR/DksA C4-type zinc finger protein [Modicisalibacter radicis]|uniref:TraR/DksA C4-type zinc finger protein n=1 Tax=Halomonas sp. EAR18 TaxID=2518972 RepID=UPI00109CF29D|nr:TraR/DksA C4-type zinc finger protein [Halomonas sp. EAR18]